MAYMCLAGSMNYEVDKKSHWLGLVSISKRRVLTSTCIFAQECCIQVIRQFYLQTMACAVVSTLAWVCVRHVYLRYFCLLQVLSFAELRMWH
jgi:hypothetical protein